MFQSCVVFSLINLIKHALTSGTISTGAEPFIFKINFGYKAENFWFVVVNRI